MAPSYRKINYSLRPAKTIERKMLVEAINRLSIFGKIEEYNYTGFGSTFFSDFLLFHRLLGIEDMHSIEKDVIAKDRFAFNKPFSCIKPHYEHSNVALPKLNWSKKSVLWLDYDDPLESNMFLDIQTFFTNATSGSMFIISVNAEPDQNNEEGVDISEFRLNALANRVTTSRIPPGTEGKDLTKSNLLKTYLKIITNQIKDTLSIRNGGIENPELKMVYKQLFNFRYEDGATMFTTGGVIIKNQDEPKLEEANFSDLSFIKTANDIFNIEIPSLTLKEIKFLEMLLPHNINLSDGSFIGGTPAGNPKLPAADILKYAKIYRYFPNFAEAIF